MKAKHIIRVGLISLCLSSVFQGTPPVQAAKKASNFVKEANTTYNGSRDGDYTDATIGKGASMNLYLNDAGEGDATSDAYNPNNTNSLVSAISERDHNFLSLSGAEATRATQDDINYVGVAFTGTKVPLRLGQVTAGSQKTPIGFCGYGYGKYHTVDKNNAYAERIGIKAFWRASTLGAYREDKSALLTNFKDDVYNDGEQTFSYIIGNTNYKACYTVLDLPTYNVPSVDGWNGATLVDMIGYHIQSQTNAQASQSGTYYFDSTRTSSANITVADTKNASALTLTSTSRNDILITPIYETRKNSVNLCVREGNQIPYTTITIAYNGQFQLPCIENDASFIGWNTHINPNGGWDGTTIDCNLHNVSEYPELMQPGTTLYAMYDDGSGNTSSNPSQPTSEPVVSKVNLVAHTSIIPEFDRPLTLSVDKNTLLRDAYLGMSSLLGDRYSHIEGVYTSNDLKTKVDMNEALVADKEIWLNYYETTNITVTFNANGGTFENGGTEYSITTPYKKLGQISAAIPTYTGKSFQGWTRNGATISSTTELKTGDVLYAKYSDNVVDVTLDANAADATLAENKTTYQLAAGSDLSLLPAPTRPNYAFVGWMEKPNCKNIIQTVSLTDKSMKLYAKWTRQMASVTIDANGGKIDGIKPNSDGTYTVNVAVGSSTSSLPTPHKDGQTFASWEGGSSITGDMRVKALYTNQTASIDLIVGAGNCSQKKLFVTYNEKVGSLPTATLEGYTLESWVITGTDTKITPDTIFTEATLPKSLTAKWTPKNIKLELDANGGVLSSSEYYITYGNTFADVPTPTKENNSFVGWQLANGTLLDPDRVCYLTTTTTLKAVWETGEYTIRFFTNTLDSAWDEIASVKNMTATCGKTVQLPKAPSFAGATFKGWYLKDDSDTFAFSSTGYSENATVKSLCSVPGGKVDLYAKWTPKTYRVSFSANKPNSISGTVDNAMPSVDMTYGDIAQLPKNTFVIKSSEATLAFDGWNTHSDGSGVAYDDEGYVANIITQADDMSNVRLYAQWTIVSNEKNTSATINGKIDNDTDTIGKDDKVGVAINGTILDEGKDYDLSITDNENGSKHYHFTFKGDYSGEFDKTYNIKTEDATTSPSPNPGETTPEPTNPGGSAPVVTLDPSTLPTATPIQTPQPVPNPGTTATPGSNDTPTQTASPDSSNSSNSDDKKNPNIHDVPDSLIDGVRVTVLGYSADGTAKIKISWKKVKGSKRYLIQKRSGKKWKRVGEKKKKNYIIVKIKKSTTFQILAQKRVGVKTRRWKKIKSYRRKVIF